jgi:hypothetical protein
MRSQSRFFELFKAISVTQRSSQSGSMSRNMLMIPGLDLELACSKARVSGRENAFWSIVPKVKGSGGKKRRKVEYARFDTKRLIDCLVRAVEHVAQIDGRHHGHHRAVVARKTHCDSPAVCKAKGYTLMAVRSSHGGQR